MRHIEFIECIIAIALIIGCSMEKDVNGEFADKWSGYYSYLDEGPGFVTISYSFQVKSDGKCELEVVGTQVAFNAFCRIKPEPERLQVFYREEKESAHSPDFMGQNLKAGDLLFTVVKSKNLLKTEWGKIKPYYKVGNFERSVP